MQRASWTSRRALLRGAASSIGALLATARLAPAGAASFCSDPAEPPAAARPLGRPFGRPLGRLDRAVTWGVAVATPAIDDPAFVDVLAAEKPRFVAIANGLKFGDLYATEAQCLGTSRALSGANWTECDAVVALAARLGVPVRGDCLAWNDWLPAWLSDIARTRPPGWQHRLQVCFERHFTDVFGHIAALDRLMDERTVRWVGLVNEPFNPWVVRDGAAAWRTGAWLDAFGADRDGVPGYITRAFDLGARLRPSADVRLFLNEANCENDHFGPLARPAVLKLVDALQRSGRPLDAVGLECHLVPQWMNDPRNPDWSAFTTFLKALAERHVKIYLTELDVNDCSLRDRGERDALVARTLGSFVRACTSVPAVEMLSNWDFSDKYAWLREDGFPQAVYPSLGTQAGCVSHPPCPRPDIYDQAMRPKPARQSLADALASMPGR